MKRLLTTAILAISLVFVSCGGKDNPAPKPSGPQVVPVTGITFDKTSISLGVTETFTIEATVHPSNATDKNVLWWWDVSKLRRDNNGVFTVLGSGKTEVFATVMGRDEKMATCEVEGIGPDVYFVTADRLYKNGFEQSAYKGSVMQVCVSSEEIYATANMFLGASDLVIGYGHWKNGIPQFYYQGNQGWFPWFNAIAVSGNDVYAGGYQILEVYGNFAIAPRLYKNGVEQPLDTYEGGEAYEINPDVSLGDVNSLAVLNGDVYATGRTWSEKGGKRYYGNVMWKNGKVVLAVDGELFSVFAANGNIYVVGYVCDPRPQATLWVNNVPQRLSVPAGTEVFGSKALGVFVSGSDVYVHGYYADGYKSVDTLWKNNVRQDFPAGVLVETIFVHGKDVYVGGGSEMDSNHSTLPTLWKNGEVIYRFDDWRGQVIRSIGVK